MRKRAQYKKPKPLSRIPTLLIMILTLCAILLFGKDISSKIAAFFEPQVPVSDAPQSEAPQALSGTMPSPAPTFSGSVMQHANTHAAQSLLPIIARGSTK